MIYELRVYVRGCLNSFTVAQTFPYLVQNKYGFIEGICCWLK